MPGLVRPHGGGSLKPLMLGGEALAAERDARRSLRALRVSSREKGDLIMLGIGGFTPLDGFMTRADWQGVCDGYRTASGLFWPIPITLSVDCGHRGRHHDRRRDRAGGPRRRRGARHDDGHREVRASTRRTSACRCSAPPTPSTRA